MTAPAGDGTHAQLAPASGCSVLVLYISSNISGLGHIPLPICALPRKPAFKPTITLRFSYAGNQICAFTSPLRTNGPASINVWISSPVRSMKPVLMKIVRSLA